MDAQLEDILARQPTSTFEAALDEAQAQAFHDNGFTSIGRITTDEEVAWLAELYDWLFAEKSRVAVKGGHFDLVRPYDSEGEDLLPQVLGPEHRLPQLKKTAFWANGRRLAAQLMAIEAKSLHGWGHMIRKPARIGEALPWHQDEAYWDPGMIYRALGCWMPLDPATLRSGCMRFVPGSHRGAVRAHRHVGDDPGVHALVTEVTADEEAAAVSVPVAAGGAVFHQSRTLHASWPNVSDHVRRAYANEWQLAPAKAETEAERPWIAEGRAAWKARAL